MLAMILAGGRGTRLHELTNKVAKPAVSYGGKYKIIDFPISNCANSGIDVVGVLTQYESILLNSYVAAGRRWGLDAKNSGVYVLPPREKADANLDVYRGTADAISQNIDFVDTFSPDYLLILSGDHIYKMNYAKMLQYHKECGADATIAVIEVPMKEASRFGIMNTDENGRIVEFQEKPAEPKSNLASMGIYIFDWKLLRKMLISDMKNPDSSHDFGKDIIPTLLKEGKTCTPISLKATGKMLERLILSGKQIWICWTRTTSWILTIPPGRSIQKMPQRFHSISDRMPRSKRPSLTRDASLKEWCRILYCSPEHE